MSDISASGVIWQGCIPLAWHLRRPLQRSSREVNAYLHVLHEYEQNVQHAEGQQALHAKLDLALAWLARSQIGDLPPPHEAELGLAAVSWLQHDAIAADTPGVLAFSMSGELPCLLEFDARITDCQPAGMQFRISAALEFACEEQEEAFSRLIFGRHRQLIRQQRGSKA